MTPFESGWDDVISALGLTKTALAVPPAAASQLAGKAMSTGVNAATKTPWYTSVRKGAIGEPINFGKELLSGKAFTREGMMYDGLRARSTMDKALLYGLPAFMGYQTMKSDAPDKAQQMGGLVASTLGTNALFRPFGMLGSMLAYPALDRIGRGAVNVAQKATGTFGQSDAQNPYASFQRKQQQPQQQQQQQPQQFQRRDYGSLT